MQNKHLTIFANLSVLMALIFTTIMTTSSELWSEQLVYVQAIIIIGGVAAAIAMAFSTEKPRLTAADTTMVLWWTYVMMRTYLDSDNTMAFRNIIVYTTLTATYTVIRLMPKQHAPVDKIMVMLLLAATIYESALGMWQACSGTSHHRLYLATGSMFNPGPYSAYVALGMTIAIGILHDARDDEWSKPRRGALLWTCAAIVIAGCFIVIITRSRSAMMAIAMATAWIFRKEIKRKYVVPAIAIVTVVVIMLFYMKMGSAMGRIVIWRQALGMITDKPIFGYGIGSFGGEYGRQLTSFFADSGNIETFAQYADVADYAFCDLLQVFAEQGVIGGALCLTFTVLSLVSLNRQSPHLALALASLMAFSLFSYPMQLLPLQTITVCLAACGQSDCRGFAMRRRYAAILAVACSIETLTCQKLSQSRLNAQNEYANIKGMTHSSFIADYYRLLPLCTDNKQFLFDFARLLHANGRYLDACAILRRGTMVSGDPMFHVLTGNSLRAMNKYDEAVECYDRAFGMLPNRLYPLYRKMLLYKEIGDTAKARQVANKLLEVIPKVESSATREMRKDAKDI